MLCMGQRAKHCSAARTRVVGRGLEGWIVVVFERCLHDGSVEVLDAEVILKVLIVKKEMG